MMNRQQFSNFTFTDVSYEETDGMRIAGYNYDNVSARVTFEESSLVSESKDDTRIAGGFAR